VSDFLTSVLPSQGPYFGVGIRNGIVKQTPVQTVEDLDAHAQGLNSHGIDAYFALASFADPAAGRTADNAVALRSFFVDLDCGPGKPYLDQPAAAQALAAFIQATGLPSPTVVNSGGGLHVYWPLTADVPAEEWAQHARALKKLCADNNLHADPAVTADRARILRVPGTSNYKTGAPRPVQIVAQGQPTSLPDFVACLPMMPMSLAAAKQFGMDEATKELAGDFPSCSFTRIVKRSLKGTDGCGQIKIAIVDAATLEEPLWRAALSIATRCTDGAKAIHTLSKAHPGYTPANTEAKAAETKGPYTCEWYRANNARGCAGCTHKIGSPIMLGKIVEQAPVENDQYIVEKPEDEESPAMQIAIPAYPFPYFRGAKGGVFKKDRTPDGEEVELEIYPHDLYLTERFYDCDESGEGEGEMVGINLHMSRDGVRRFYAPVTTLFTKDKMRDVLLKHGVMAYGKQLDILMAYFASTIRKLQQQFSANRTRNQMGWTPDMQGFVVGELEYTPQGAKLAPPASGTRQLASSFRPTGSLEEWSKIASFYNREGLEPHALAFFFGFGSPLLKLIGGNSVKGAQVHLKHNGSGSGKSTVQMVVNSIFGNPDELLMKKDDSFASKMHRLGMMNSIAYTIDEITNEEPKLLSEYAYGFSSGRGRHRMEAQTNKMRANYTTWCNITLTSGNASVIDALMQLKSTADGELRRILELSVPKYTGATKSEIDAVFGKLKDNYGVAGPVYIQYVLQNMDSVREACLKMQSRIDEALKLDQSDRFYSCILAVAFTGAAIARRLGLFDIDIKRVYEYALKEVSTAKQVNRIETSDLLVVARETLASFLNDNVNNALVINHPSKAMPSAPIVMPRGALKMRYEPDTQELFITVSEFRSYFAARQVDVKESTARLAAAGVLKYDGKSHPTRIGAGAVGSLSGPPVRCYVFDGAALGLDKETFTEETEEAA
jgi:uncharacterized protein (DUF927 family)